MSWLSASAPPPRGALPATLEGAGMFCVKTAALAQPAAPARADADMVLLTAADGGVVVYPPSEKLVILATWRTRQRENNGA